MENPTKKTIQAVLWVLLGIAIGLVPGAIKIDEMRQAAENAEAFHARSMADLKKQMKNEEWYYIKQMSVYRAELGIRRAVSTETDKALGITCAEEFTTSASPTGMPNGVRSWKPRNDGRCYAEDGLQ
jgi:hypothetical protein